MKIVMFSESTFEDDLKKGEVNKDNYQSVLLVPRNKKLPTVDALILPNKCLQITKQTKGHSIAATKCFLNILEKMKRFCDNKNIEVDKDDVDTNGKRFRFVFIVLENLFDNFGPQEVQCNEDLSENYREQKAIELSKNCQREIETNVADLFEKLIK
jgi:hypothetical protein